VARQAQLLADADHDVRYQAVKALEKQGPAATEAVPALATALADSDPHVRYRSAKVLSKIGYEAAAAADALAHALDKSLQGPGSPVQEAEKTRYYLVKTLSNLDDQALPALAGLIRTLQQDTDPNTRYYAVKALGKIGAAAKTARPALEKLRKDPDQKVRRAAGQALAKIHTP